MEELAEEMGEDVNEEKRSPLPEAPRHFRVGLLIVSLPRFFLENQVLAAETEAVFPLRLAPDDAKHARVLRLAAGSTSP